MRVKPTERHYDPERVEFPAVNRQGDLEPLTIFHPWPQSEERRVVLGRIVMLDHKGEKVVRSVSAARCASTPVPTG